MNKIQLSDNHRRSVSSSIYLIEKMIIELEHELIYPTDTTVSKIPIDSDNFDIEHYRRIISQIKDQVKFLYQKYNLKPKSLPFSQLLNARKAKMWEILCNTSSKAMRGYGEFPKQHAAEYDNDIMQLIELVQKL